MLVPRQVNSVSANPMSLPPTVMVTIEVVAPRAPSCLPPTSATVAPEHAWKLSAYPPAEATSPG